MTTEIDDAFDHVDTRGYLTIDSIIEYGQVLYAAMTDLGAAMHNFDPDFVRQNWTHLCSRSLTVMSEVAYDLRELCRLHRAHPDMDFEHESVIDAWPDIESWPDSATTAGWLPVPSDAADPTIEEILRHNTHLCVQAIEECAEIAAEYIDSVGGWYDSVDVDADVKAFDHNVMHLTTVVLEITALWQSNIFDAHATVARSMQAPRPEGWEKLLEPRPRGGSNLYSE